MLKAPQGGQISVVNGRYYVGGQIMPDHGLYCDKKAQKDLQAILERAETVQIMVRHYRAGYSVKPEKYGLTKEEWIEAKSANGLE